MREEIMTALETLLASPPLIMPFTGSLTAGDATVRNVTLPDGGSLLLNMPISGQGVADGTTVAAIDPVVQLSLPATATLPAAELLQGFRTHGRRLKFWSEVTEQPAVFVIESDEDWTRHDYHKPALVQFGVEIWIYSKAGENPDAVPSIALNTLIEAIDAQLQPERFSVPQTLALLGVAWVGIEGRIEKSPGHIGGQAIARVPLKIAFAQGAR